jgi:SAM-dependent methyltransferase
MHESRVKKMSSRHVEDIRAYNRQAWDKQVEQGNRWTVPVSPEEIARAREGDWAIYLTPTVPVPRAWFPPLNGLDVLCLASGGGQQGPILAAAGARVSVLDNSPRQLAQDRLVAGREGLSLRVVEGDMADLSAFEDRSFGLIFHPVSNVFIPEVRPVWREAFRVLRPGGALLAGFMNPANFIFDRELAEQEGILRVKYRLPYDDLTMLPERELNRYLRDQAPLEYGHTLEDQIGGQLRAGFYLQDLFEDRYPEEFDDALDRYMPTFIATRAVRPANRPRS